MLPRQLLALVAVVMLCGLVRADEFPYTAYVTADDVYVRSGPGEDYYPVTQLRRGAEVEVYRHDPGGWYAVRPLDECFSWVASEYVKMVDDEVAVVIGDRVAARVGSVFSDVRDVIQVRLDRGEEVVVLGKEEFDSGDGPKLWYKIAPPAGEFRWLTGKYVDREYFNPERQAARETSPWNNLLLAKHARPAAGGEHGDDSDTNAASGRAEHDEDLSTRILDRLLASGRDATSPRSSMSNAKLAARTIDDAESTIDAEPPAEPGWRRPSEPSRLASFTSARSPAPSRSPSSSSATRSPRLAAGNIQAALVDLDLALSAIVAEESAHWDFTLLRKACDELLASTSSAVDRGHVRLFVEKIDHFQQIHERWLAVSSGRDAPASSSAAELSVVARASMPIARESAAPATMLAGPAATAISAPAAASQPPSIDPAVIERYDGVGRLAQVIADRQGSPYYALLDDTGRVRYYVTAAPGVNLRPHLGSQVGVTGTLGYLSDKDSQHLTARRVDALDATILR